MSNTYNISGDFQVSIIPGLILLDSCYYRSEMVDRTKVDFLFQQLQSELRGRGESWRVDQLKLLGLPSIIPGETFSSWIWRSLVAGRLSKAHLRKIWKLKCEVFWADTNVDLIDFRKITKTLNATSLNALTSSAWVPDAYLSMPQTVGLTADAIRKRPIYRYCPQCFKEDEIPHIRQSWRLAFTYVCEQHELLMEEQCPRCHHFLSLEKTSSQAEHWIPSLRFCMQCGHDLSNQTPRIEVPGLLAPLLRAQKKAASYTVYRQLSNPNEQLKLDLEHHQTSPGGVQVTRAHMELLSNILMRLRYFDGREVQTLYAGIAGTDLFEEDAERVGSFFAKHKLFRNTFWFPENVVFHSYELKTLKAANKWLRVTKSKVADFD